VSCEFCDHLATCIMGSVQPRLCYSIFYELVDDIVSDYIYFQLLVKFINLQNQCVLLVITHKMPVTGNSKTFLSSVDVNVLVTLIAKRCVLEARRIDDIDSVLEELDSMLKTIGLRCGSKDKRGMIRYPEELSSLPELIYLLRRSPLLGPIVQHPDDIDFLRCLFLNGDFEVCKRLIRPSLFMIEDDENLYEVPLEDLAMQSNKILLLDHHTEIFIWSGLEVANSNEINDRKRAACLRRALESAQYRFPKPTILQFKESLPVTILKKTNTSQY